jgi:hypothetical protein
VDPLDVEGGVTKWGNGGETWGVVNELFRRGKVNRVIEDQLVLRAPLRSTWSGDGDVLVGVVDDCLGATRVRKIREGDTVFLVLQRCVVGERW